MYSQNSMMFTIYRNVSLTNLMKLIFPISQYTDKTYLADKFDEINSFIFHHILIKHFQGSHNKFPTLFRNLAIKLFITN